MTYAIIKVAGKQYRVREGERLLVDRLHQDEGSTFAPTVLLVGGDGGAQLEPGDGVVQAKVLGEAKGPKIRIGKPMDFTAYAEAGNDRDVLRWVTDEIMNAIMELSGQAYVDVYGGAAKAALEAGKPLPPSAGHRPGAAL